MFIGFYRSSDVIAVVNLKVGQKIINFDILFAFDANVLFDDKHCQPIRYDEKFGFLISSSNQRKTNQLFDDIAAIRFMYLLLFDPYEVRSLLLVYPNNVTFCTDLR